MTNYSHQDNVATIVMTFKMKMQKITKKIVEEQLQSICGAEIIFEEESDEDEEEIKIKDLEQAPPKMEDNKPDRCNFHWFNYH